MIEKLERPTRLDEDKITALKELFPSVVSDGKINFDALREELSDDLSEVEAGDEHYGLYWSGKRKAKRLAAMPPTGTLIPAHGEGVDEDTTKNLIIEGDNLEVLRILQKSYAGRVKLIYIDPPYNTGEDFLYNDAYAESIEYYLTQTNQQDEMGLLSSNPKSTGRFHSRWLTTMFPRLNVAASLLRDDGFIVVSIDDGELQNLTHVMDEIFGEENRIAVLVWDKNRKNDAKFFSVGHEYMLVYAKSKQLLKDLDTILRMPKEGIEEIKQLFAELKHKHGNDWATIQTEIRNFYKSIPEDDERKPLTRYTKVDGLGPYRDDGNINWPGGGGPRYEVLHPTTGKPCKLPKSGWRYPTKQRFDEEHQLGRIVFGKDETTVPSVRMTLFENSVQVMRSVNFSYAQTAANDFEEIFDGQKVFDNPKPIGDIANLVSYLTGKDDCVLDFFAGSGTTAHAVFSANVKDQGSRSFICVQIDDKITNRSVSGKNALGMGFKFITDVTKERIRRVSRKLKTEGATGDLGFKVMKLERSNFIKWRTTLDAEEMTMQLGLFARGGTLIPAWKRANVLTEIMLLEGYPLDSSVQASADFLPNNVEIVTHPELGTRLLICLDETPISEEAIDVLEQPEFKKDVFICLERAITDELKARAADRVLRVKAL